MKTWDDLVIKIKKNTRIDPETQCWLWTKGITSAGYGKVQWRQKQLLVHRITFLASKGMSLDCPSLILHRCGNKACCNPDHLYDGTVSDNVRDCIRDGNFKSGWAEAQRNRTHCPQGHEYTTENTRRDRYNQRYCKQCARDRYKK